ncbi:MAG TPA: methylmalonyl-CoA mutase family protein [Planctomycetota bacterium]|nr:methylmalonyl-CoA mutase family protein [Planctomycetota bacterium]
MDDSAPGQFPFTRGIYPRMYADRPWTFRQYAGYSTAEETNRRYRFLLERGQTGLSVAFDLPTQMGYDPDHPLARGEVGKSGVSIASLADQEALFADIPLDKVTVSMTINATAIVLLALHVATAEKHGIDPARLGGTVQNDILKEFVARGCYLFPPKPSLKVAVDIIEHASRHLPQWNFISVSGYHIREAGATASQELGFTLANGIAYMEAALKRGLDPDVLGRRISFFFNAHNDFVEEIAKFRAARRLWAVLMRDRFKAKDPRAQQLRFHTQTAGSTLTAQQPHNNVVRVTLQAMAALLGGTQSLHTNAMDEALALPSEEAARVALRTQQILAHETGICDVVDPFGGSVQIEQETDRLEAEAKGHIDAIDRLGGAASALDYERTEIEKSARAVQREIEDGKRVVVGVNKYEEPENGHELKVLRVDEKSQIARRDAFEKRKAARTKAPVDKALSALRASAAKEENLFPAVLDCVKAEVTLGEICNALVERYGRHDDGKHA